MGKYSGILICSDIDGTLTYETGKISLENLDAINRFMKEGGLFTISSGRTPGFIRNLNIPINAPVISTNGAFVYDYENEKYLSSSPMTKPYINLADKIRGKFSEKQIRIRFIYEDSWDLSWPEYPLEFLKSRATVYKLAIHTQTEKEAIEIRDYVKRISTASVVRGWETGVEITEPDISKGSGLIFLKNYFKNEIKTTIAVGNFENDVPILKTADVSVVVDNAPDDIKKYADKIAPANTEHAIRFIIDNLDLFSKH